MKENTKNFWVVLIVLFFVAIFNSICFVAARDADKVFESLGTKVDLTAVKSCLKILKDKQKPLVIFPTGTRTSEPDEVENLKNGVVMFALKAKAPIVPMVLVRKAKFLRRNRLVVGEPIDITPFLDKKADKETYAEIIQILGHRMEELIERYSYKKKKTKHKNKEVQ